MTTYVTRADLGGQHGHGPIVPEPEGELFHADWEPRALALTLAMGASGSWNIAQAFAMALRLQEHGVFTWSEWADALAGRIAAAQAGGDADLGDTYYRHWLAALEALVSAKGVVSPAELARWRRAWDRAAGRPPHGQPIEVSAADLDG